MVCVCAHTFSFYDMSTSGLRFLTLIINKNAPHNRWNNCPRAWSPYISSSMGLIRLLQLTAMLLAAILLFMSLLTVATVLSLDQDRQQSQMTKCRWSANFHSLLSFALIETKVAYSWALPGSCSVSQHQTGWVESDFHLLHREDASGTYLDDLSMKKEHVLTGSAKIFSGSSHPFINLQMAINLHDRVPRIVSHRDLSVLCKKKKWLKS